MDNFGASVNGPPGARNAGQGQGTTGTTTLGGSAIGVVVDNTGFGTTQTALRQSGIHPDAFLAAGVAAAAGAHQMAPTAPPWPNAGLGLNLNVPDAMMMNLGGAGAATGPPTMRGGGGQPQLTTATYGAAAAAPGAAFPDFGQRFPGMAITQAQRGGLQMGGAGMAGLTLLGQVAHLSPGAGPTGGIGDAAAAAGLGGATGGAAPADLTRMYSNVGGAVNQAIAGAGDGLRPLGTCGAGTAPGGFSR